MKHLCSPLLVLGVFSLVSMLRAEPPHPEPFDHRTIEELAQVVREGDADSQCQAMIELAERGQEARPALGALRAALDAEDTDVRATAILARGLKHGLAVRFVLWRACWSKGPFCLTAWSNELLPF